MKKSSASTANVDILEENENPTRAYVEELLRTKAKLTETVEKKVEEKRAWRRRDIALGCSNWKLESEVKKLRAETDELDKEVLARIDANKKYRDDLETYKSRNKREAADFRIYFEEETQKYSNLFTNAHIEYSSDRLDQDIKDLRIESESLAMSISRTEVEMEAHMNRYGLVELGTNEEAKLLANLRAVKNDLSTDQEHIIRSTEAAERNIRELKLKVEQKEQDIADLKKKLGKRK